MAEPAGFSINSDESGYSVDVDSEGLEGLSVSIDVELPDDVEPSEVQQQVVTEYGLNIETFIRKNLDYGSSFSNGPKIESILKYGEVREEEIGRLMAKQIFVRGFLDKISRFYNLYVEDEDATVDESVMDTVLDLGNYAHMLASQVRRYENHD